MKLRKYQSDAIDAIRDEFADHRATLAVLATGLGKTVIFSDIAKRVADRGGRTLVIAHRGELLIQAARKLEALGICVGVEKAAQSAGNEPVVVASVQTLRRERLASWDRDAFRLVVVDEAHRAAAKSYRAILDHFSGALVLGVTATPDRLDGKAMGDVFDSCAYRYGMQDAIRDGWLAPLQAQRITVDGLDLSSIRSVAGDLHQGELDEAMRACVDGVVGPLLSQSGSRPTIVFAVSVAHAHALADAINARRPGSARAVDGRAKAQERSEVVSEYVEARYQYLVNCALFTEGFDAPSTACIAVARPTKSRALYTQMVGRGTRLAPDKQDCLILDFAGLAGRHSLAGPLDALTGEEPDDVRELAAELTTEQAMPLEAALEQARGIVETRKREAQERKLANWWAENVDPFASLPFDCETGHGPEATESQRDYLERKGLHLPEQLSRGKASQLIGYLEQRRSEGLATFKQMRLLRRHHIDARGMTFEDASAAIGSLARKWRRSA